MTTTAPKRTSYVGVVWDERARAWLARISDRRLGHYDTAGAAARRYDEEALRVYGRFARVNFPKTHQRGL